MSSILLREAIESDCEFLFNLVNQDSIREASFSVEPILFENHCSWFSRKLNSKECKIYILEVDRELVGQIRLEFIDLKWRISYSVDENFRGNGYGEFMLKEILKFPYKPLYGEVKTENIPSQKAFEKIGYVKTFKDEKIIYTWM